MHRRPISKHAAILRRTAEAPTRKAGAGAITQAGESRNSSSERSCANEDDERRHVRDARGFERAISARPGGHPLPAMWVDKRALSKRIPHTACMYSQNSSLL